MRIGVIGGGPAGLYFAMLAARSGHEVTVKERNPADATYGWGVVFSEGTLTELQDADYESYLRITESFVRWNAIDVWRGGEVTRSVGHGFSAIARRTLLQVLQDRCRAVGVMLAFEEEVAGPEDFADAELVVAADGVNSRIRDQMADRFEPEFDIHPTRYTWLGTDLPLDAFTFYFEETTHGLFQVHAYPFDERTSTFIIECTEEAWRRAGLDQASEEESLAFGEKVFADRLRGHRLMSNRSQWINFVTLRNRNWHHENVVLMGDAAATAHFSIGSGTKLAMEGAVALHKALIEHPRDLDAAFAAYELERMPAVERFQQAARDSSRYFESVSRYLRLTPARFAFNLLTRSGRLTHLGMEQRDPSLTAAADRELGGVDASGRLFAGRPALLPLRVGEAVLGNRLVTVPAPEDDSPEATPGPRTMTGVSEVLGRGLGLVVSEPLAVVPEGRTTIASPGLWNELQAAPWRDLPGRDTAGLALVLGHAGRRAAMRDRHTGTDRASGAWRTVAPSPLPYLYRSPTPWPMTGADFENLAASYAAAAGLARSAAPDVLVLDLAGGFLLHQFLSPLTNHRQDSFGGSPERRNRFPLRVLQIVRGEWAGPLAVRIPGGDEAPGGLGEQDMLEVARGAIGEGADLIWVAGGAVVPRSRPTYRRWFRVPLADKIRNELGAVVVADGAIRTLDDVDTLVTGGRCDLCVIDLRAYLRQVVSSPGPSR